MRTRRGRDGIALLACVACALLALVLTQASAHADPLASGCGTVQRPGVTTQETIDVDGTVRTYRLHIPTRYNRNVPVPLVLAFHGHWSGAASLERVTGFSRLADARGFLAVYPQGAVGPDRQTGWNTGRTSGPMRDPTTDDVAFVRALLAKLQATLCVDVTRIYAAGFSNGGGFVARLACTPGLPFAAVGIVSGDYVTLPGGCNPGRAVSLMEVHGTGDTINPYDGSAAKGEMSAPDFLAGWVARDGCVSVPQTTVMRYGVTREEWTGCAAGASVLHYRLAGVGHIWPSGSRRTDRFSATAALWAFFAGHRG